MTVDGNESVGDGDYRPPVNTTAETVMPNLKLMLNPNNEHKSDSYDDLQLEFSPWIFSSLEKFLPLDILRLNKEEKAKYMSSILLKYLSRDELSRAKMDKEYKQKILSNYQPLNRELYTQDPTFFLHSSFLNAINENTEESFRNIISAPSPGIFVFQMFKLSFCEMMLSEVENIRKWVNETKFRIKKPNAMSKYGIVLDDFGLDGMLDELMERFLRPISNVLFPDMCALTLDSHHGFVVEYGEDRDVDLGFHVDDSEVTLNVCLGKQFVGGDLYFRGARCERHVNTDAKSEEIFDYCHLPGQAVIHRGSHRHGARATTSGRRVNMILWCRSSVFREMKNYTNKFPSWCGQCFQEKKEKQSQILATRRKESIRIESEVKA